MVLAPSDNTLQAVSEIPVPVPYTGEIGLLPAIGSEAISASRVVPKMRIISSAQFATGNYPFPTPATYVPTPYALPILEPQAWEVDGELVDAYVPVQMYRLGNIDADDMFKADFPIRIAEYRYGDNNQYGSFRLGQSVRVIVWKEVGVKINWAQSNIANNGMPDSAIEAAQLLVFDVTNREGIYAVTSWVYPNFMYEGLNNLDLNGATTLAEVITAINARTTTAGGDLTGTYPNPTIKQEAVSFEKMQKISPLSIMGNTGAVGKIPEALTPTQVRSILTIHADPQFNFTTTDRGQIAGMKWKGQQVYCRNYMGDIPANSGEATLSVEPIGTKFRVIQFIGISTALYGGNPDGEICSTIVQSGATTASDDAAMLSVVATMTAATGQMLLKVGRPYFSGTVHFELSILYYIEP